MDIIMYAIICTTVYIIAFLGEKLVITMPTLSSKDIKKTIDLKLFSIIIIVLVISIYSASLGASGGMVDRQRYIYSFLIRYPGYFHSNVSIFEMPVEFGFVFLNIFIRMFTDDTTWVFFFSTLIASALSLIAIKNLTTNFKFGILMFMVSLMFVYTTFLLKQVISLGFASIAISYYVKGNKKLYFVYSFLAMMFHATAIYMIPVYFIYEKIKTKKGYIMLIITLILVFIFFNQLSSVIEYFLSFLEQYIPIPDEGLQSGKGSFGAVFKGIPYYIITAIMILKEDKLKESVEKYNVFLVSSILVSFTWLFSYHTYWAFRIGLFFMIPVLAIFPKIINSFEITSLRIMIFLSIFLLMSFFTYRQVTLLF